MSYLELLWIPAILGWIPLIYADELSTRIDVKHPHEMTAAPDRVDAQLDDIDNANGDNR